MTDKHRPGALLQKSATDLQPERPHQDKRNDLAAQPALTTSDQAASRYEPATLSRDVANALFDMRWTADDGALPAHKYPADRLRELTREGLIEPRSTGGHRLTDRGRLCMVSIDHVSRPVPAAPTEATR